MGSQVIQISQGTIYPWLKSGPYAIGTLTRIFMTFCILVGRGPCLFWICAVTSGQPNTMAGIECTPNAIAGTEWTNHLMNHRPAPRHAFSFKIFHQLGINWKPSKFVDKLCWQLLLTAPTRDIAFSLHNTPQLRRLRHLATRDRIPIMHHTAVSVRGSFKAALSPVNNDMSLTHFTCFTVAVPHAFINSVVMQ